MTSYLIRRIFQMILVVFFAALFTYFLFNISPGGPLVGFQQQVRRVTREDIARLRAQYELDLYWPVRFARWLVGFPTGPITVGGRELFAECRWDAICRAMSRWPSTRTAKESPSRQAVTSTFISPSCPSFIRRSRPARASCAADFGLSTVILKDRPVTTLLGSRHRATLLLMSHFAPAFVADRRAHRHL